MHFLSPGSENRKNIPSKKNPLLYIWETELSGTDIKKFLIFQETEFSYISGNGNPKKLLIFQEVTFQAQKIFKKIHPEKISYIFSKESFSYISGNGNPEKIRYISGNGTFLYFGKGIFRTLAYLELERYSEP